MGKISERKIFWLTAGAAVIQNCRIYTGFTLIEVMVVVIVIGILATLAYSSLIELISTNRAKETAQTIRTFTERAMMDGKRLNKVVRIRIDRNTIIAETEEKNGNATTYTTIASEIFNQGFSASCTAITDLNTCFNTGATSQIRIGISGITEKGYFAACDSRGYCGGAGKAQNENSFKAYIKRGNSTDWGAL